MRGRAASVALPALIVVVLVAVVAIAATGSTPGGSDATRPPSRTLYDILFTIGLTAVALGGVLFLYGVSQRKAIASQVATGKYPRTTLVTYLVAMGAFGALFYFGLIRWRPPTEGLEADAEPTFPGSPQLPTLPDDAETSYTPSVSWIPMLVVFGLLLAGLAAYVISERRARRGRSALREPLAEQLAAVLDETLDDIRAETDPRRAIIAAYARLERTLASNGVPRRPAETSDEYLERTLRELELAPRAIRRLTNLFQQAKFSDHELDETMKGDAIDALEQVRDELRRAPKIEPVPEPVGAAT